MSIPASIERNVWWANGQLARQKIHLNDGLEEVKCWDENGQVLLHEFYRNGTLEGECKTWHRNGQMAERTTYKNGLKDGECESWYEDGRLSARLFFQDDKLKGECKFWNEDDGLCRIVSF